MDYTALLKIEPNRLTLPQTDLSLLPGKLSRRLWVAPEEFLVVTSTPALVQWALQISGCGHPKLDQSSRRGPKPVYQDGSVMILALVQVAWQMSYEEVIDYFRAHPTAAQLAGFPVNRVISIGQYWERRRALGILPFWFLFIALVGQLICLGVIKGSDLILDATTLQVWFHRDPEAAWSFPKPWKGSVWGYKVHTVLCRWSQLPVMFLVSPTNR